MSEKQILEDIKDTIEDLMLNELLELPENNASFDDSLRVYIYNLGKYAAYKEIINLITRKQNENN